MSFVPVESYGEIYSVGPGIWCVDGEWRKTTFRRRMTILSDRQGNLAIHNPFYLQAADYQKVSQLGEVRWILAPNRFHASEVGGFLAAFPKAELHVSPAVAERMPATRMLPDSFRSADIFAKEVGGTRGLGEILFFHPQSKTLVVTDLIFHGLKGKNRLERAFFRANGLNQSGPSRIFKFLFTKNEQALLQSIREVLQWDFDQLIPNHGEIVKSGARELLRVGFAQRFPKQAAELL
jgi:hypothetical protein